MTDIRDQLAAIKARRFGGAIGESTDADNHRLTEALEAVTLLAMGLKAQAEADPMAKLMDAEVEANEKVAHLFLRTITQALTEGES